MRLEDVPTPALLLDLDVLEANLRRMADRARDLGVRLRPHVKTHKCPEVGRLQRDAGADGITVATLEEARAFAEAGFDDLTWAFPVVPGRLEEARAIADEHGVRLGLLVDDRRAVEAVAALDRPFPVWLEVDCGDGRSGVDPEGGELIEIARTLEGASPIGFAGLLTHGGHAYAARSAGEAAAVAEEERAVTVAAAERLRAEGIPVRAVSVGSTPGMTHARRLAGVDEARPGNYALFDRTQVHIGSCRLEDVAATVLATVVSSRPGADHCVVDAGALALSKDAGPEDAPPAMGRIFADYARRELHEARVASVSQEHGVVDAALPYGSRVRILPNHACLTVACHDRFHVVRGGEVVDRWRIHRAR